MPSLTQKTVKRILLFIFATIAAVIIGIPITTKIDQYQNRFTGELVPGKEPSPRTTNRCSCNSFKIYLGNSTACLTPIGKLTILPLLHINGSKVLTIIIKDKKDLFISANIYDPSNNKLGTITNNKLSFNPNNHFKASHHNNGFHIYNAINEEFLGIRYHNPKELSIWGIFKSKNQPWGVHIVKDGIIAVESTANGINDICLVELGLNVKERGWGFTFSKQYIEHNPLIPIP